MSNQRVAIEISKGSRLLNSLAVRHRGFDVWDSGALVFRAKDNEVVEVAHLFSAHVMIGPTESKSDSVGLLGCAQVGDSGRNRVRQRHWASLITAAEDRKYHYEQEQRRQARPANYPASVQGHSSFLSSASLRRTV